MKSALFCIAEMTVYARHFLRYEPAVYTEDYGMPQFHFFPSGTALYRRFHRDLYFRRWVQQLRDRKARDVWLGRDNTGPVIVSLYSGAVGLWHFHYRTDEKGFLHCDVHESYMTGIPRTIQAPVPMDTEAPFRNVLLRMAAFSGRIGEEPLAKRFREAYEAFTGDMPAISERWKQMNISEDRMRHFVAAYRADIFPELEFGGLDLKALAGARLAEKDLDEEEIDRLLADLYIGISNAILYAVNKE